MVGIYLSGTGNTKYCIEKLVSLIHSPLKAPIVAMHSIFLFFQMSAFFLIKSRTIYGALENFVGYPMKIVVL